MRLFARSLSLLAVCVLGPDRASAQVLQLPGDAAPATPRDAAYDFLAPYGLQNFPPRYLAALQALLRAEEQYEAGHYASAQRTLHGLWERYPTGTIGWGNQPTQPFGINLGTPPCYYGLRMLTDTVDWRVASGVQGSQGQRTVRLTVVVVGQTTGIEPRDVSEIEQGTGIPVVHALDGRVPADDYRVVHQSLALFREYVFALTEGQLAVETHVLELPGTSLPVHAYVLPWGGYYAGLVDFADVWASVPTQDQLETDWWWVLYPSHVPEQYPDFEDAEFITGGMGTGPDGGSPCFLIDDRWLVRKPPHLGDGPYTDVERRAYLPQWLQHEFFHHLFRTWREFGLEDTPHQWFDLGTWPPDFEGRYEADYFHEALYRRLQAADPPLHVGLRYATADAPWDRIVLDDVLGTYRREPVENAWHIGDIRRLGNGQVEWRNTAGVSWDLDPDLAIGILHTGPDCPYYDPPNGTRFDVVLRRDEMGDLTPEVEGFRFTGELYERQ